MNEREKEELLAEIEKLMAYGREDPTIDPSLLKYLDSEALQSIVDKLKKRQKNLIEEEKEWLSQFRKE